MLKTKKLIAYSILSVLLLGASSKAFANPIGYTAYLLPSGKGNNYTGAHTSNKAYITNKFTALTSTDQVTMWATDTGHKQTSVGMENTNYSFSNAFVSGTADWF